MKLTSIGYNIYRLMDKDTKDLIVKDYENFSNCLKDRFNASDGHIDMFNMETIFSDLLVIKYYKDQEKEMLKKQKEELRDKIQRLEMEIREIKYYKPKFMFFDSQIKKEDKNKYIKKISHLEYLVSTLEYRNEELKEKANVNDEIKQIKKEIKDFEKKIRLDERNKCFLRIKKSLGVKED